MSILPGALAPPFPTKDTFVHYNNVIRLPAVLHHVSVNVKSGNNDGASHLPVITHCVVVTHRINKENHEPAIGDRGSIEANLDNTSRLSLGNTVPIYKTPPGTDPIEEGP